MPIARHLFWTIALALAAPAMGQDAAAKTDRAADTDIVVTAPERGGDCIASGKDGERRLLLACLTRALDSGDTTDARARTDTAAVAGRQPPSRTGTFSHTATAQRMGSNFGKSARPQRPVPPVYAPPMRGTR